MNKVSDIIVKENTINLKNSIYDTEEVKQLLPKEIPKKLEFKVSNSSTVFINSIRRVLIDELPSYKLYFELTDIDCNDVFIISDLIRLNLSSITLNHTVKNHIKQNKLKLNFRNNTNVIQPIYTHHIENSKDIIPQNICLGYLNPYKYIKINNIYTRYGCGVENSTFNSLGTFEYDILDFNEKIQSTNSDYKNFKFGIMMNNNGDPKEYLIRAVDIIIEKLNNILEIISNKDFTPENYSLDNLSSSKIGKDYVYKIYNNTHTIASLLTYYIIKNNKNIELCKYNMDHFSHNNFNLYIRLEKANTALIFAIKEIIKDYENFKKEF